MTISRDEAEKTYPILKYFTYDHLPANLQDYSRPISLLAYRMAMTIEGDRQQVQIGLQKLIEAKDCFVRAKI